MSSAALTRRELLLGAAAWAKKPAPRRPNIVLVLADNLAAWMLGCYGNQEIRTPNIDLLARSGTRFPGNYVCAPVSPASRATLFTGRTPMQLGIEDSAPPPSFRNEVLISDLLAGQGYHCAYAGKWDLGDDPKPQHGFQLWYTLAGDGRGYRDPQMSLNGELRREKGYLADLITAKAVEFLDAQKPEQPFFLVVSHLNPHVPYDGHPQKYYDLYAGVKFDTLGWEPAAANASGEEEYLKDVVGSIRRCAAAVTALDDQVPPLIAKLDARGLRDNTVVLFTSDNGFLLGRHGLWSNGLASTPINMYEEVVVAPMIWNWPGKIPVGGARPELVSFYDVLPTLSELTGAPLPPGRNLCGRSYLPAVLNRPFSKKQPWHNLVFGHFRNTEMVRDTRYKLIVRDQGKGPGELYDERLDPRENANQYANPAFVSVRDALSAELESWRAKYSG